MKCVDLFSSVGENGNKCEVSKYSQDSKYEQKNSFKNELENTQQAVHVLR